MGTILLSDTSITSVATWQGRAQASRYLQLQCCWFLHFRTHIYKWSGGPYAGHCILATTRASSHNVVCANLTTCNRWWSSPWPRHKFLLATSPCTSRGCIANMINYLHTSSQSQWIQHCRCRCNCQECQHRLHSRHTCVFPGCTLQYLQCTTTSNTASVGWLAHMEPNLV